MKAIKLLLFFIFLGMTTQSFAQEVEGTWQLTDVAIEASGISAEERQMIIEAYEFDDWIGDILELKSSGVYALKDKNENLIQEGAWKVSGNSLYTADYLDQVQVRWEDGKMVCPVDIPNVDGKPAKLMLTYSPM